MRGFPWAAASTLLLLGCADLSAQVGPPIRFCAARHNLPLSAAHPPSGVELEVARAVAARLGTEAEFVWREVDDEGLERGVLDGLCDAALGVMVETGGIGGNPALPGVIRTTPYYGAGYVLVHRPDAHPVASLEQLGGVRIAVEAESVPVYTLKQRGQPVHVLFGHEGVVRAIAEGRVEYGYLWGPMTARLLAGRTDVVVAPGFQPDDRWNYALAVREGDRDLRASLDRAIRDLAVEGRIEEIFARRGVPYLRPTIAATASGHAH